MVGKDRIQARPDEQEREQVDYLDRARGREDVFGGKLVALCDLAAQFVTGAVRVAVQFGERRLDSLDRARRRAERVLIGGELDRFTDAQLALQLLRRFPGLVRRDRGYGGQDQVFDFCQGSAGVSVTRRPTFLQDMIQAPSKKGLCVRAPSARASPWGHRDARRGRRRKYIPRDAIGAGAIRSWKC